MAIQYAANTASSLPLIKSGKLSSRGLRRTSYRSTGNKMVAFLFWQTLTWRFQKLRQIWTWWQPMKMIKGTWSAPAGGENGVIMPTLTWVSWHISSKVSTQETLAIRFRMLTPKNPLYMILAWIPRITRIFSNKSSMKRRLVLRWMLKICSIILIKVHRYQLDQEDQAMERQKSKEKLTSKQNFKNWKTKKSFRKQFRKTVLNFQRQTTTTLTQWALAWFSVVRVSTTNVHK